jgi:hypothetical protein
VSTPEEILAIQNEAWRHRKEGLKLASAKHSFQGSPAMSWRKSSAKSFRDSVESEEGWKGFKKLQKQFENLIRIVIVDRTKAATCRR